jgi:hypothetical protein
MLSRSPRAGSKTVVICIGGLRCTESHGPARRNHVAGNGGSDQCKDRRVLPVAHPRRRKACHATRRKALSLARLVRGGGREVVCFHLGRSSGEVDTFFKGLDCALIDYCLATGACLDMRDPNSYTRQTNGYKTERPFPGQRAIRETAGHF